MKVVIIYLVTMALLMMVALNVTSCTTKHEQESTTEQTEKEKRNLRATVLDSNTAIETTITEEWKAFKASFAEQVSENERKMADIRAAMGQAGKKVKEAYRKSVDSLRAVNEELKRRVEDYARPRNDWQAFKKEFNRDMNMLRLALRDFSVNNI